MKSLDLVPETRGVSLYLTLWELARVTLCLLPFSLTLSQLEYNSCILGLAPEMVCLGRCSLVPLLSSEALLLFSFDVYVDSEPWLLSSSLLKDWMDQKDWERIRQVEYVPG